MISYVSYVVQIKTYDFLCGLCGSIQIKSYVNLCVLCGSIQSNLMLTYVSYVVFSKK